MILNALFTYTAHDFLSAISNTSYQFMTIEFRNRLLGLLAPIFWSITSLVIRLLEEADEWQINFYRSTSLALFLLVYLGLKYRANFCQVIKAAGRKAVLGGVFIGIAMFSNIVAMQHTTIANATMVMATGPIVAALFGWMLLGETVSRATWLAIAMAALGLTIMVGGYPLASVTVPAVELTLFALGESLLAPIWVWLVVSEVPATSSFIGGGILLLALLTHLFAIPSADRNNDKKAMKALADSAG